MTYYFLGSSAAVGDQAFERFGESADLDEGIVRASADRCVFLPADQFKSIGFTDEELRTYYSTELHSTAPVSFLAKRDKAWELLRAYRETLKAAPPAESNKEGE